MDTVCLAHWREVEARARAEELRDRGFRVEYEAVDAGVLLKRLREDPPAALVVDLSRSPAQGRDLALAVRIHSATRRIPLIFVEGTAEKVAGVRKLLPDAAFTTWDGDLVETLKRALANPPGNPVVPSSALAGYSGTPLPKKLGIKSGGRVLLVGAPPGFGELLDPLPENVRIFRRFVKPPILVLWFVRSVRELERGIEKWRSRVSRDGIWIIWPKRGSDLPSDLTANVVRRVGLESGWVDYKIAAIDENWSGLKFAIRQKVSGRNRPS